MSRHTNSPPLPVQPAPALAEPALAPLLDEPFASAWALPPEALPDGAGLRQRLARRVAASRQHEAAMFTQRRRQASRQTLADGVIEQRLYQAAAQPLRPGEPLRVSLVELAPGSHWQAGPGDAGPCRSEWLLLAGGAQLDGQWLSLRDYHVVPAGGSAPVWHSRDGALLFRRDSVSAAGDAEVSFTVRDSEAGWSDFAPGVRRRVLWQHAGQASMLYHAAPGAVVPQHRHGHAEECLLLQGELFLDDLLLQAGDYQLAPAGSGHRNTQTDTGAVIYAHGDLDLQLVD